MPVFSTSDAIPGHIQLLEQHFLTRFPIHDFVIEGCEFAKRIVDNILIWAPTLDLLEKRILQILKGCANINVTISRKKFAIGTEIPFAGFLISDQGIKPDPQKTVAIASFPTPKNITDLQSFLGLANQLAFFLPDFEDTPFSFIIGYKNPKIVNIFVIIM